MKRLRPSASLLLLLACSTPDEGSAPASGPQLGAAGLSEASAPATAWLSAEELEGRWSAATLALELRADGSYAWTRSPEAQAAGLVPPFAQEGRWTLHSSTEDAAGTPRASVLRLGPDGKAGTLVPILGSATRPLLELIPGALLLARE